MREAVQRWEAPIPIVHRDSTTGLVRRGNDLVGVVPFPLRRERNDPFAADGSHARFSVANPLVAPDPHPFNGGVVAWGASDDHQDCSYPECDESTPHERISAYPCPQRLRDPVWTVQAQTYARRARRTLPILGSPYVPLWAAVCRYDSVYKRGFGNHSTGPRRE